MKVSIAFVTVVVLVGCAMGGPIAVQDNNIGDIVTVGVNIQADIKTDIDSTIVNILVAMLTEMGNLNLGAPGQSETPAPQQLDVSRVIGSLKALGALGEQPKEQTEKIFSEKAEKFVQQLLKKN